MGLFALKIPPSDAEVPFCGTVGLKVWLMGTCKRIILPFEEGTGLGGFLDSSRVIDSMSFRIGSMRPSLVLPSMTFSP